MICGFCGHEMPRMPCCPHCARPAAAYPNVCAAEDAKEKEELENRYNAAASQAEKNACSHIFQQFEEQVGANSCAVIAKNLGEAISLLGSDNVILLTYYKKLKAGMLLPIDDEINRYRKCSEEFLFPDFKEDIHFAALALDNFGVKNYAIFESGLFGDIETHLTLDEEMIAHRTTVFERNNVIWLKVLDPSVSKLVDYPKGFRAVWEDRGKIAAVKTVQHFKPNTDPGEFPELLLKQGDDKESDDFIEAHIFGSISRHTLKRVVIKSQKRKTRALMMDMAIEKARNSGLEIEVL